MKLVHEITINALLILHYKNNEHSANFEMHHIFYPPAKDKFKVPSKNSSNSNCSSLAILYIENNKTYAEESRLRVDNF
ncbi:hypothetical protein T07_7482 [Trichinella nelsoni]|uniref:Uncharacterized protein n=1 Tax=Trichinella nelsoni TaxID=6336 RepID=A0A0V0RUW4_9BILA|nr:hypothetical protein T07_7482 [Trichinella nelsoni]